MHSWLNSTLRIRLILLVLLAVIPALGLIIYTASEQRRSATAEAQKQTLQLARLAANNQRQIIEGTRQLLVHQGNFAWWQAGGAGEAGEAGGEKALLSNGSLPLLPLLHISPCSTYTAKLGW